MPRHPPRKEITQEEKKRGQRLFGGLLTTLSQKPFSSQYKRRQEIEKRQRERAQQANTEEERELARKREKLEAIRLREQINLDEKIMHMRHRNMLSKARYLKTKSDLPVFYLPYETTDNQEDEIHDQIRQAKKRIDLELTSFACCKADRLEALGLKSYTSPQSPSKDGSLQNEKRTCSPSRSENQSNIKSHSQSQLLPVSHTTDSQLPRPPPPRPPSSPALSEIVDAGLDLKMKGMSPVRLQNGMENSGEEVLETAEDTVIY